MTPHFQTYPSPRRPLPPEEEYLAGDLLVPPRDYLLYSRLHLPTLHLSALASTKLSTNLQGSLAFMHSPGTLFRSDGGSSGGGGSAGSGVGLSSSSTQQQSGPTFPPSPPANLLLSLQQDHGRWATEYTYSAKDGMVGLRGLWNFGLTEEMLRPTALEDYPIVHKAGPALSSRVTPGEVVDKDDGSKRGTLIDQEYSSENGLRGRFSAGGEIYFSVKQRSLGCEFDVVKDQSTKLADRGAIRLAFPQYRPDFALRQYPTRLPTRPHPYPHLQPLPSSTTL